MAFQRPRGEDAQSCLSSLISEFANGVIVSPKECKGRLEITTVDENMIGTIHKLGDRLIIQELTVKSYSQSYPPGYRDYDKIGSPLSINVKAIGTIRVIFNDFRDASIAAFIRDRGRFNPEYSANRRQLGSRIKLFDDDCFRDKIIELIETMSQIEVLMTHPYPDPFFK